MNRRPGSAGGPGVAPSLLLVAALVSSGARPVQASPPVVEVSPEGCAALGLSGGELADLLAAEIGPSVTSAVDGDVPAPGASLAPLDGAAAAVEVACAAAREVAAVTLRRSPPSSSSTFEVQLADLPAALRSRALALRIAEELRQPAVAAPAATPAPPPADAPVAPASSVAAVEGGATTAIAGLTIPGAPRADGASTGGRSRQVAGGLAIGLGALGVVCLGAGAALLATGSEEEEEHRDAAESEQSRRRTAGIALAVSGGALVLGAAISTVVWARTSPGRAVSVTVVPTPGGAMATAGLRF